MFHKVIYNYIIDIDNNIILLRLSDPKLQEATFCDARERKYKIKLKLKES